MFRPYFYYHSVWIRWYLLCSRNAINKTMSSVRGKANQTPVNEKNWDVTKTIGIINNPPLKIDIKKDGLTFSTDAK